jgi:hypothetical protein
MKACPCACVGPALGLSKGRALSLSGFDAAQLDPEPVGGSTVLTVDPEGAEGVDGSKGPLPPHRGRD